MSSTNSTDEKFWIHDPIVLFRNFCNFNPLQSLNTSNLSKNFNSYTRFILILMIILYSATKKLYYIYVGIVLIVIIIALNYFFGSDSFESIDMYELILNGKNNLNNPVNNYVKDNNLLNEAQLPKRTSDYFNPNVAVNNPLKNTPITDYDKKQEYSKATLSTGGDTSSFVKGKIFQTENDYVFDTSTRQFYTMPNTTVPNDQTSFANWLYGTENICKEGSIYMHRLGTPKDCLNCTGFNVSTPTNFGNLNDSTS